MTGSKSLLRKGTEFLKQNLQVWGVGGWGKILDKLGDHMHLMKCKVHYDAAGIFLPRSNELGLKISTTVYDLRIKRHKTS